MGVVRERRNVTDEVAPEKLRWVTWCRDHVTRCADRMDSGWQVWTRRYASVWSRDVH